MRRQTNIRLMTIIRKFIMDSTMESIVWILESFHFYDSQWSTFALFLDHF